MKKTIIARILTILMVLSIMVVPMSQASAETIDITEYYKNKDVDASYDAAEATVIDLSAQSGQELRITEKGEYLLSGTWTGQIRIEAPEEDKVRLILDGVTVNSPAGPAIYEAQADKLIITLADGSKNVLTDGPAVTVGEGEEADILAAGILAKDDLSINGSGALTVNGTQKHGIQSKADLIIAGGTIQVSAVSDAIRGKNSVLVLDGILNVTAGGDGIVSTRTDREDKGYVIIAGGSIDIKTGGGAGEVKAATSSSFGGRGNRNMGQRMTEISSLSSVSMKGIKAATNLIILGGMLNLDTEDDGLHAVNLTIYDGSFAIESGDDGMHADELTRIDGGTILISKCYEGVEGKNVLINGGELLIVASDDGINAAGGNDASGFGGRGNDRFGGGNGDNLLIINGGRVNVTAGGDGLDSNGSLTIAGGEVYVWTATTMGDGALDFNGTGTMTGGTVIIAARGGVMRDMTGMTGISMMALSTGTQAAGTEIALKGTNGIVLGSFAPSQAFDTVVVASEQLASGETCSVLLGGSEVYSGAVTGNLSSMGQSGWNNGNGRGGRQKGW